MTLSQALDDLVGRAFGEFVLREKIGEGGFGAVYRAHQPALDREAVVKVLHARLNRSPAAAERFLREAKLASKLDHPYAAHIYAFGAEKDGQLWIAMELVRGTPLDQILSTRGPIALDRLVPLLERICEVVHTAHELGIVHRDLKPANVMVLTRANRLLPKLLNLGIAKGLAAGETATPSGNEDTAVRRTRDTAGDPLSVADTMAIETTADTGINPSHLTQVGSIMGSPPYMAPEQWVDAGQVDRRTDGYALAVLAYEVLTGRLPFKGKSVTETAMAHASAAVPPLGPPFPQALDAVFGKALAKLPDDRYVDALAFAGAFREASGIASDPANLPALDPVIRDATIHGAPQPIAEALALYDAARNAHQARDAIVLVARTMARYLGELAIACRSRVGGGDVGAAELVRILARRTPTDREWLAIAAAITHAWVDRRDAFPLPELIAAFHDRDVAGDLDSLLGLREREVTSDSALATLLEAAVARLASVLDALAFVREFALVVPAAPGVAERWMGVRRAQRSTVTIRGKPMPPGEPVLLDRERVPVLTLAPLFQIVVPTPGAPLELFLFEGRDRRGARFVSLPAGFEHHDDAMWDWFRAQLGGSLDEADGEVLVEKAPYLGLSAFSSADGEQFFGRERQVDAFVNRLKLQPLLAVVGRSGAGKSSFVHAGVIPALPAGWRTVTMRPGPSPIGSLVARLEHAGLERLDRKALSSDRERLGEMLRAEAERGGSIALVVDQLEEMFTLCTDEAERTAFAEAVVNAARTAEDRVRVIFTLRDDFLVRAEQVPALRNRIAHGLQLLTVPAADDLLRILVEPARRAGYEFDDPALPKEMVAEVADQPGALALVSFTALKLWELRDRHFKQLTRSAYKTLGGVGGALAKHAEQTLDAMRSDERSLARSAFRHLVTTAGTRAVIARGELVQLLGNGPTAEGLIEKLTSARLLVATESEAGAETVEVVHEALLVAWPRLVDWLREDAEGARFREQLRAAAKQWQERDRGRGLLWRGDALADLTRWRARHAAPLTDAETAFANASVAEAARGRRNRRILMASGFAALGAIVVVLFVSNTRIAAQRAQAIAAVDKLNVNVQRQWEDQGRLFMLNGEPLQGLAALAHAGELGAHGWAHDLLIAEGVRATDGARFTLRHGGQVRSPRFSHDDTRILTASIDGKARLWDADTGKLVFELPHDGVVARTAYAPDDATVLTASFDGTARWWDAKTGHELRRFKHEGSVWCALFSPDGKLALTAGDDGVVALWELASGAPKLTVNTGGEAVHTCAFAPDGSTFAAGDVSGRVRIWKTATGQLVATHADQHALVGALAYSPDGARLVAGSDDHTAAVWDLATGQTLHVFHHKDVVYSVEFARDSQTVLTGSYDGTAVLWGDDGQPRQTLAAASGIQHAVLSPDGRLAVGAAEDGTAQLWDVETGATLARWRRHDALVWDASFDHSGHRVVTASNDDTAIVWAVQPQENVVLVHSPHGTLGAKFSSDGTRVAIANLDGTVRLFDATSGIPLAELQTPNHASLHEGALAIDPRGTYVAAQAGDGSVYIWELAHPGRPRFSIPDTTATAYSLAWSPDGSSLAIGSEDGYLRLWSAATRAVTFRKLVDKAASVSWVTFHPDGKSLAIVTADGLVRTWDLAGNELARARDPDEPETIAFDATGERTVSANAKQTIKIRRVDGSARELVLVGHTSEPKDAVWGPGGRTVLTTALDGTARLWDAETGDQLAIYPTGNREAWIDVAPDGRILTAAADGTTVIRELPRYRGSREELEHLLRCRVPFEVRDNRLELRETDRVGCEGI